MRPLPLKLGPGSDLRGSLEQMAIEANATGFVLSVVGDLSRASFQCPERPEPTVMEGPLEIITLQGTVTPRGVHLHLSVSDGEGQVRGGHLEHGTVLLKGAELLVGLLAGTGPSPSGEPRVEIAVRSGCPFSARALRMLRTLGIDHRVQQVDGDAELRAIEARSGARTLPQVFIDGKAIGGYDALAEWHGRGELEALRSS